MTIRHQQLTSAKPCSPDAGFTLVELMVVIAIIASAASLIAAFVAARPGPVSLQDTSRELAAHLRRARLDAITRRREQRFVLDTTGRSFWRDTSPAKAHAIAQDINVEATTARSAASGGTVAIVFFADGTSTGGRIVLRQGDRGQRIEVDWMTGAVYVSSPVSDNATKD